MFRLLLAASIGLGAAAQPVVLIQPDSGGERRVLRSPDGFVGRGATLLEAVAYAFDTEPLRVIAPQHFAYQRYHFEATTNGEDPRPAFRAALEKHFAITTRMEIRPTQVWVLRRHPAAKELAAADVPDVIRSLRAAPESLEPSQGVIQGAWAMEDLVRFLQASLNQIVMDETGSRGYYSLSGKVDRSNPELLIRSFREELGLDLRQEYRDVEFVNVLSSRPPDTPAPDSDPCRPDAVLEARIRALPDMDDLSRSFEKRIAPRWELARAYPDNVIAALPLLQALRPKPQLAREWDRALAFFRGLPDRKVGRYLEAALLSDLRPLHSRKLLEEILATSPGFAWAYLTLGDSAENSRDAKGYLYRFQELCPSSVAALPLFANFSVSPGLREVVHSLGRELAKRTDDEALDAYPLLWRLRRKMANAEGPTRIEVARLRLLDRTASLVWARTLAEGYKLLGDRSGLESLIERVLSRQPSSQAAWEFSQQRWQAQHGSEKNSEAARKWQVQWPHLPQVIVERWEADAAKPAITNAELLESAAMYLEVSKHYPGLLPDIPAPLAVAEALALRKLDPARVRELAKQGLSQAEEEERYSLTSELEGLRSLAERRLSRLRERATPLIAAGH